MAIIHFVNYKHPQTNGTMLFVLNYVMRDEKTIAEDDQKYVTGINCSPGFSYAEFRNTKRLHRKEDGRLFFHCVQSFKPEENITPAVAHEIALRFIRESEKFHGFEVVVATHCDRDHIHSHFVINSVNADTGRKFHTSQEDVEQLMKHSDSIIRQYGLSVVQPKPKQQVKDMPSREYRSAAKGESWKMRMRIAVDDAMQSATCKEHFIALLEAEGFQVKWTGERKNITYTDPDGHRCRDDNLSEDKYLKVRMEHEFRIREEIVHGRTEAAEQNTAPNTGDAAYGIDAASRVGANGELDLRYWESASGAEPQPAFDRIHAGEHRNAGTSCGSESGADGGDTGAGAGPEADGILTGWEKEREIFLHAPDFLAGNQLVGGASNAYGHRSDLGDLDERRETAGNISSVNHALDAGLRGIGAVARLFDTDSDDPEERHKRMEAEQAASNFGAVVGLAAGLIVGAIDHSQTTDNAPEQEEKTQQWTQSM